MAIDRNYLLKKPSGPSAPKRFFDTRVVPLAVNGAGALEGLLARSSARTGVRPAVLLVGLTSLALVAVFGVVRNRDAIAGKLS